MAAASQELIRDMNYHKILEAIIRNGCISRADLAKELGLTKATVSSQVQALIQDGLAEETGSQQTSKGRRPIMLKFCGSHAHVLSMDIGLHKINLLLSDLLGQHCYSRQISWNQEREQLLSVLLDTIEYIIKNPRQENQQIIGICLGIHGVVYENEILFTPYYNLEHMPLKQALEQHFSLPVWIENEANLSALGEKTFSFGVSNLVNISVHSGIGLGIIMDGHLYTGADGFAGEFGHTIIEPQGRPCPCGNQGCLEQYASETAILRKYNQLKNTSDSTIDDLVADYLKKEGAALFAISDFVTYMAMGINNIVNIFNPQLIVINSTITAYLPDVTENIYEKLKNRMSRKCRIVPSVLQDTATLLGGVCLCSRSYLELADFCPPL